MLIWSAYKGLTCAAYLFWLRKLNLWRLLLLPSFRLLNVLEVIAPFKHFNKLREFVQMKLPPGFPVKLGKQTLTADRITAVWGNISISLSDLCFCGFLQTSLSFLLLQPRSRFRSFATTSSMNPFLPFPLTTKKTQAAFLTFNLSPWFLILQNTPFMNGNPGHMLRLWTQTVQQQDEKTLRINSAEELTSVDVNISWGVADSYSNLQIWHSAAGSVGNWDFSSKGIEVKKWQQSREFIYMR